MNSFHLNHQSIALGVLFLLNTVQTQAQATGEGNPPFETSSNAGPTITLTDFTAPSGSKVPTYYSSVYPQSITALPR
jgi:hypothetical protein